MFLSFHNANIQPEDFLSSYFFYNFSSYPLNRCVSKRKKVHFFLIDFVLSNNIPFKT